MGFKTTLVPLKLESTLHNMKRLNQLFIIGSRKLQFCPSSEVQLVQLSRHHKFSWHFPDEFFDKFPDFPDKWWPFPSMYILQLATLHSSGVKQQNVAVIYARSTEKSAVSSE